MSIYFYKIHACISETELEQKSHCKTWFNYVFLYILQNVHLSTMTNSFFINFKTHFSNAFMMMGGIIRRGAGRKTLVPAVDITAWKIEQN